MKKRLVRKTLDMIDDISKNEDKEVRLSQGRAQWSSS